MNPVRTTCIISLCSIWFACSSGQTEEYFAVPHRTSGPKWRVAIFPVESLPADAETARAIDSDLLKLISADRRFEVVPAERWLPMFPNARGMDLRPDAARQFQDKMDVDVIVAGSIGTIEVTDSFRRNNAGFPRDQWPTHEMRFVITNAFTGTRTISPEPGYSFRLAQVPEIRRPSISVHRALASHWASASPTASECVVPGDIEDEWDDVFRWRRNHDGWEPAAPNEIGQIMSGPAPEGSYPYYLYQPRNFATTGWSYPLIIYLHGTSARSDTLSPMLFYASPLDGIQNAIDPGSAASPYVVSQLDPRLRASFVLMPQLHRSGDPIWDPVTLNRLVVQILEKFPIDSRRVYLTGISRGGAGSWAYGAAVYPKLAAIAPLAGSIVHRGPVKCFEDTPIWAFHAFDDTNVGLWQAIAQIENTLPGALYFGDVNLLRDYPHQGGNSRFPADDDYTIAIKENQPGPWRKGTQIPDGKIGLTIYRSGNHAIFSRTYAKREFWDWMFAQTRP